MEAITAQMFKSHSANTSQSLQANLVIYNT